MTSLRTTYTLLPIAVIAGSAFLLAQQSPSGRPKPLLTDYFAANISTPPLSIRADPFYKKYADATGIPVISSEKVPDLALIVARDIVNHMLAKRSDIREAMVAQFFKVEVMAESEGTMDLPEHRDWKRPAITDRRLTEGERQNYDRIAKMTDAQYWNSRARGMGGNPTSCAEENLLGYPGTRYYGENIFVHEFSHGIHNIGIKNADPKLYSEIQKAFDDAMGLGLWKNSYGANTVAEYWAEGTQFWFYSNFAYTDGNKRIMTPRDLLEYDPTLYHLLAQVYPDHHIPMDVYYGKEIPQQRSSPPPGPEAPRPNGAN